MQLLRELIPVHRSNAAIVALQGEVMRGVLATTAKTPPITTDARRKDERVGRKHERLNKLGHWGRASFPFRATWVSRPG